MEKDYLTPELEIMFLTRTDVIVASATGDDTSDTGTDDSKSLGDE